MGVHDNEGRVIGFLRNSTIIPRKRGVPFVYECHALSLAHQSDSIILMITRIWMTLMLRAATFSTTCPVLSSIINSNAPALDQTIQTLQSPSMLMTIRLCWGGCQEFKKESPRLWRRKPQSRLYEPSVQTSKNKIISTKWKINFSLELFLGPWQKTGLQLFQGSSFAKYLLSNSLLSLSLSRIRRDVLEGTLEEMFDGNLTTSGLVKRQASGFPGSSERNTDRSK